MSNEPRGAWVAVTVCSGRVSIQLTAASHMTHFPKASRRHPYSVITPDTPLETLESFFLTSGTDFALGEFRPKKH